MAQPEEKGFASLPSPPDPFQSLVPHNNRAGCHPKEGRSQQVVLLTSVLFSFPLDPQALPGYVAWRKNGE